MDNIISMKGLSKNFGRRTALNNIDLGIGKGEFVAIFGPNGAGKTTLLKVMSTIIEPTRGSVLINGTGIKEDPKKIREMIGAISHETYLYNDLTARENLVFFSNMYNMDKDSIDERIEDILKNVSLLQRADDMVSSFSRGMKQRLSIARALLHQPSILLMDEPYTGLDHHAAENFELVLTRAGSSGNNGKKENKEVAHVTRIMITHNIERAFDLCDRMLIMDRGEIRFDKLKKDIPDIDHFREEYLSIVEKDTDAEGISNY